jgi:hypothetical protein
MKSAEADLKGLIDKRNSLAPGLPKKRPRDHGRHRDAAARELAALDKQIQEKADATQNSPTRPARRWPTRSSRR